MKDRITIEGGNGAFGAYIARPKTAPAPAVVVLVFASIKPTTETPVPRTLRTPPTPWPSFLSALARLASWATASGG
jgi:hypothetical protein